MLRIGFLLGFTAVLLQIGVFLQPLLPPQFQIAPVCETITRALFQPDINNLRSSNHLDAGSFSAEDSTHAEHQHQAHQHSSSLNEHVQLEKAQASSHSAHQHDINHQCQYCTVFGNLILPPELSIAVVVDRIQVRLIAFERTFKHVYFLLQRLYLIPQGRAPPLFI